QICSHKNRKHTEEHTGCALRHTHTHTHTHTGSIKGASFPLTREVLCLLSHSLTPNLFPQALLEGVTRSLGEPHVQHSRTAPQLKAMGEEDADPRANLSELLARLISSRKGSVRKNSTANSRSSGLSTNHRKADRDYLGWMDFGRRSAEEYEYSS
uniref:Gastrin/cholecystokinin peptide hormone domain-containing protein n=2 Tax=Gasterosteus aculeatus TaxID=69293 RepID=A0AAQ4PUR9_GASAC